MRLNGAPLYVKPYSSLPPEEGRRREGWWAERGGRRGAGCAWPGSLGRQKRGLSDAHGSLTCRPTRAEDGAGDGAMPQGADETARLRAERQRRVGAGHEVPEYEDGWPVNAHAHEAELSDCSPLLADPPALRRHAERRGWLYFARLLPADAIEGLRCDLLGLAARHGWLADGAPLDDAVPREGRFECEQVGSPAFRAYYADVQALRSFHALPHHPELLSALRALFDCEHPFVHPRHIGHTVFPGGHQYTTPPHQVGPPVPSCPRALGHTSPSFDTPDA